MNAVELHQQIEALPEHEQERLFFFLTEKIMNRRSANAAQWVGRKLSFNEACDVVFHENRELFRALAK